MRKSQWFVLAIAFLLLTISSWSNANHEFSKWKEFSDKHSELIEESAGEKVWSEQLVVTLLELKASTHMYWGDYRLLWEFSNFYMNLFFACMICGFLELGAEKKKN